MKPDYVLSSYRGSDRPFHATDAPDEYVFGFSTSDQDVIPKNCQMCCRFELRLDLPLDESKWSSEMIGLARGDLVRSIAQELVPDGVRVENPLREILPPKSNRSSHLGVFLIVYCGEQKAFSREQADSYRTLLEDSVSKITHVLHRRRTGNMVSRSFPGGLLPGLIHERSSSK